MGLDHPAYLVDDEHGGAGLDVMRSTPTGLADLAIVLHALNPSREECAVIVRMLKLRGELAFDPVPPVVNVEPIVVSASAAAPREAPQLPAAPVVRPEQSRRPGPLFLRPRPSRRVVEPPRFNAPGLPVRITEVKPAPVGMTPPWVEEAEELDLLPGSARTLPTPVPLVPVSQLRAFVTDLITGSIPGEPDIPKLVEALARGQLPRVLPRLKRKGAARRIHVLLDTADSMRFFRSDAVALLRALDDVAGPAIRSENITYGTPELDEIRAARGDMFLVISDFGIGSRPGVARLRQRRWRDFAVAHAARGVRITGVVPLHRQRWPHTLTRHINMVHWHPPGDTAAPATAEQVYRLAAALSLAAVIDPALLRAARLHLIPGADAGAEVDLMNGWWTGVRNPRVIAFLQNAIVRLRSDLAADPAMLVVAKRLLERERERTSNEAWDRVRFEEELVYLALTKNTDVLKSAFARLIRSLLGRMRDHASARWALSLLEELPEDVRETEAGQLLRAVASVVLNTDYEDVEEIIARQQAGWLFRETVPVGVRWTGDALLVRDPPVMADRILQVPDTTPRVVIVDEGDRKRVLRVTNGPPAWMYLGHLPVLLKTAAGAEYQLDKNAEGWAAAVRAHETGATLRGVVTERLKGRFRVDIGVDAALTKEHAVLAGLELESLVGSELDVRVTAINIADRSIEVELASYTAAKFSDEAWQELERRFTEHETVQATVIDTSPDGWIVELFGVKVVVAEEHDRGKDRDSVEAGQELEFFIRGLSPKTRNVTLSRHHSFFVLKQMLQAMNEKTPVAGTVIKDVKGGFQIDVGMKAFGPGGQMDLVPIRDPESFIGRTFEFLVIDVSWDRRNIIVSRKQLLERERDSKRDDAYAQLEVGTIRKGRVKNITDYGVFVDLNGIDGLLHLSDISWSRVNHPSEFFAEGDEIEVVVLSVNRGKDRVALGHKQLTPDPWLSVAERYAVGQKVEGRVMSLADYGAFVEIEPGVSGLIHVSEMSWMEKVRHPSALFTVGQHVAGIITTFDFEARRIALSYRALQANPWAAIADRYPVGAIVIGTVRNLTDFGAFIMLEEGVDGLIHVSEMSWHRRPKHPSELLKKGETVQARVTAVDPEKQRIALSMREFVPKYWDDYAAEHSVGEIVQGAISNITDFGLFVRLAEGVEGLLHGSEVPHDPNVKLSKQFTPETSVTVRIIKIDRDKQQIGLSMKDVPRNEG